jgi:molecular chaperone GrpE
VEVVEDEDDEEEEEAEEAAPPTRVSEIMARLQEAVDAGTGGDVLAELLPELTTEVTGIESAFKDIQAANVGLEDQAAAVKDQFLRLTADFDNFKKRTVKEKQQLGETAKSKVFEAMLPALDNFDLAKANLKPESEEGEKIMSQYQGLYEGLMTILSNQGLTAVDGVGAPFDPNFHEAIMREESADAAEDTILEEFRKGYKLGENTLIRPAMVKVSAAPSSE